jgi:hypothetical protein
MRMYEPSEVMPERSPTRTTRASVVQPCQSAWRTSGPRSRTSSARKMTTEAVRRAIARETFSVVGRVALGARERRSACAMFTMARDKL